MSPTHYDALVLGSGQAGTPLAKAFAAAGRKVALVDRAHVGGTCVNEGCTPTKTMIASGRVAYLARRAWDDYGVGDAGGKVRVDMAKIRQRKRDIVDQFRGGSEGRLDKAGVDIIRGEGRFVAGKERTLLVKMAEGGEEREVSADLVFINVGEGPSRPQIPGLKHIDPKRVLDSTSIMELDEVPRHLVVLGGGYIGLEFGQLFRRLGAQVTIVQRGKQLVPREDEDIAGALLGILAEDGILVHLSASPTSFKSNNLPNGQPSELEPFTLNINRKSGQEFDIQGTHILLATGRIPMTANLNLDAVGIKTTPKGHIVVNDKFETGAPGIYALGDVHGGPAFTHISYDDYRIIRANLLPGQTPSTTPPLHTSAASKSRNLTPYVVYTDPQLGHVGLHARDLAGRRIKTAAMPMSYVARALETDETRGVMKATVDAETGEILGFTCLGVEGGEIMAVVQTAMMGGLKWWDLEAAVWAHPSLAESLNNLWGFLE
ncbi:FAD/NAD(P)-binding domain-containing protein [Coniochaeta ligniaria NRRL 30616]|uniref:FAD/NAD(P)-binding domain-containing protein n=1 Tax=Coniochaeta ligniaria NRRL 30616 TaxID=1408157 RepID=A0A1J7J183_9PEZI|nr:FAD/NAD(P)-binding domain-containing protein [Coniochaeta ligniaria NRRL 30616]